LASNSYETVVVLDIALGDEKVKEVGARIEALIAEHGGQLQKREDWGKKRMTYEIRKKRDGYYILFVYDGDTTSPLLSELKRLCHIEEAVLREMTVRAEVGKSAGDPAQAERALSAMNSGPRPGSRYGRDRGGPHSAHASAGSSDSAPAAVATETVAADAGTPDA